MSPGATFRIKGRYRDQPPKVEPPRAKREWYEVNEVWFEIRADFGTDSDMMKRLSAAICAYFLTMAMAFGQASGGWSHETELTVPGWVSAYAQMGPAGYVYLTCPAYRQGLSVAVSIRQAGLMEPQADTIFIRVGEYDYGFPWAFVDGDGVGFYDVQWPEVQFDQPWPQQETLLTALAEGKPLMVMASRQPDKRDARVLMTALAAPGDPAITALNQSCGASAPATPPPPSDWLILPGTDHWTGPTAMAGSRGASATIMAVCDGSGRPFLAAQVEGYPYPEGQMTLPADIDGQRFQLN